MRENKRDERGEGGEGVKKDKKKKKPDRFYETIFHRILQKEAFLFPAGII